MPREARNVSTRSSFGRSTTTSGYRDLSLSYRRRRCFKKLTKSPVTFSLISCFLLLLILGRMQPHLSRLPFRSSGDKKENRRYDTASSAAPSDDGQLQSLPPRQMPGTIRCVILSDTHNHHEELTGGGRSSIPDGDMLIHLGDAANRGDASHIRSFAGWLSGLPHRHKVLIDGNHDRDLHHPDRVDLRWEYRNFIFLQDETVSIEGINILGLSWKTCGEQDSYGHILSSFTPSDAVPATDTVPVVHLLLTHAPPRIVGPRPRGSRRLFRLANQLHAKLHLFGHIHFARGIHTMALTREKDGDIVADLVLDNKAEEEMKHVGDGGGCTRINCSTIPVRKPVVIDFERETSRVKMIYLPRPCQASPFQHETYYF